MVLSEDPLTTWLPMYCRQAMPRLCPWRVRTNSLVDVRHTCRAGGRAGEHVRVVYNTDRPSGQSHAIKLCLSVCLPLSVFTGCDHEAVKSPTNCFQLPSLYHLYELASSPGFHETRWKAWEIYARGVDVLNPLPTIGNSLRKQKSLYKVLTPSIKPSI